MSECFVFSLILVDCASCLEFCAVACQYGVCTRQLDLLLWAAFPFSEPGLSKSVDLTAATLSWEQASVRNCGEPLGNALYYWAVLKAKVLYMSPLL